MNRRTCIVTRESEPAERLIRFVADPQGMVVPDLRARLPGRGAWVTGQAGIVERAVKKNVFARALKRPVKVADDLPVQLDRLLLRRALEALGLAARAGAMVTGFAKVEAAVRGGRLALVITARDGAPDGRRKILAARRHAGECRPRLVTVFTAEEMSLALGRPNVVHAGVAAGRAAASLEVAVARLERYREGAADGACAA